MKQSEAVALIDMDGTVADYAGQLRQDLQAMASPGETVEFWQDNQDEPAWLKARMRAIKSIPGWWKNLPQHKPGMDIVSVLREMDFRLMILTKGPSTATHAWTEKVDWCRKNIPDAGITITEDKGLVYGKILVDDYPAYGLRWLEWRPRGVLIVPAHPWNTMDQYPEHLHPQIFRYSGEHQLKALREVLSVIRTLAA